MKQYAHTINLTNDPSIIERYMEHHRNVWPEVERGLSGIGIHRMLIWRLGRQLFMFMETVDDFDPARDFARYEASEPRIREWQQLMASFQEPLAEAKPTEWWAEMELVYAGRF
jgi:L-rhamnose mutarotase